MSLFRLHSIDCEMLELIEAGPDGKSLPEIFHGCWLVDVSDELLARREAAREALQCVDDEIEALPHVSAAEMHAAFKAGGA